VRSGLAGRDCQPTGSGGPDISPGSGVVSTGEPIGFGFAVGRVLVEVFFFVDAFNTGEPIGFGLAAILVGFLALVDPLATPLAVVFFAAGLAFVAAIVHTSYSL
jgi:hypothetical protein